jgi:AraC-like DNA-binding protein
MGKSGKFNNRLLITYLPAFLVFAFAFLIILTGIVNELKNSHIRRSNRQMVNYVLGYTEQTLSNIDMSITVRTNRNDFVHAFVEQNGSNDRFTEYKVVEFFDEFCAEHDIMHSIYIYHIENNVILSTFGKYDLDNFKDADFLTAEMKSMKDNKWYNSRLLHYGDEDSRTDVISMLLPVPRPGYMKGVMVVNVHSKRFYTNIKQIISDKNTYLEIRNMENGNIFPAPINYKEQNSSVILQNRISSSYNGWNFVSGVYKNPVTRWLEGISLIWIILGISILAAAVLYLFVISKANYEPVKKILQSINQYYKMASKKPNYSSDFRLIENAMTDLIETSHLFREQHEEDLQYRKKVMFLSLINGMSGTTDWAEEFESCGVDNNFSRIFAAVFEIDHYHEFAQQYSKSQRNILKYMVQKSIDECSRKHEVNLWGEWVSERRYCALFFLNNREWANIINDSIRDLNEKVDFSVTVGVGGLVDIPQSVHESYYQAYTCLDLKVIAGNKKILVHEDLQSEKSKGTHYRYMKEVANITHKVNISDDSWKETYNKLIDTLSNGRYTRTEIKNLFQYMFYNLLEIASRLSQEVKCHWDNDVSLYVHKKLDTFETLEDISDDMLSLTEDLYTKVAAMRKDYDRNYRLEEIKRYIDKNYDNPQMSLDMLSDRFGINKTFLSRLFKLQFDVNFCDYLIDKRVTHSIELLSNPNLNIDEIAHRVGYSHYVSFARSFKKITGLTPGEYRRTTAVHS